MIFLLQSVTATGSATPAAGVAAAVSQRERATWTHSPPFRDSACGDSVDSERGSVAGPLLPAMDAAAAARPQSSAAARHAFGNLHSTSLHTWVSILVLIHFHVILKVIEFK